MSLGALDFGLIVDGAVIIVENCILRLAERQHHARAPAASLEERLQTVFAATREVFTPSLVSVLVVILVNLPILALTGVEGKMFRPMALTVIMALLAALVLSLTFVPAAVALFLRGKIEEKDNVIVARAPSASTRRVLDVALRLRVAVLGGAVAVRRAVRLAGLAHGLGVHPEPRRRRPRRAGAAHSRHQPDAVARDAVPARTGAELTMPEVKTVFSRVGTAEVATDPMPPNISDGYVMLKDRKRLAGSGQDRRRSCSRRSRSAWSGCPATPTKSASRSSCASTS